MTVYTPEEAAELLSNLAQAHGLEVLSSEVVEGDFGWDVPLANLFVSAKEGYRAVNRRMLAFEKAAMHQLGGDCRTGLYYAEIGYDDVPEGQAMIEVDCLPIVVAPSASLRG
ncbi:hypothetical protein [Rhizobium leguminosarum]|uniref:hypothetical protein n=1 Tax=Rhizobium leguminosarum TaxID=384 RepID=UPI002E1494F3|nr:hypothetical protein U8Q02_39265 [Rhizobium leguminosarum]